MDDTALDHLTPKKTLTFNNRYLISGLVHGFNKGWMYAITILLAVFGYLGFQLTILVPLMSRLKANGYTDLQITDNPSLIFSSEALNMDKNLLITLELGMFVFALLGFYIGIRYLHQKTFLSVLTGFDRFRYGRFGFAFLIWGSLITAVTLYSYFSGDSGLTLNFNLEGFLISVTILAALMPLQTGFEELLFRGYFIQGLSQIFRNGIIPLFITSLLFGLAHMGNPEVHKYGWPIMLSYYCVFALFMGALTLLDEGLELAFGIHFANNFVSALLVTSPNSVLKTYSIFEASSEDPYSEIVLWVLMASLTFFIFWMRYRWKNFKLIIK